MSALALVVLWALQGPWSASVGMPVTVRDLVLPGGELRAADGERDAALVVRVDAVRPHGDRFRYDLVFYGLEPGDYDLGSALRRADGTSATGLPPLPFHVASLLPAGQIEPHRPDPGALPRLGGYRAALIAGGAAWVVGLVLILRAGRRARAQAAGSAVRGATLEERMAPLVAAARAGALDPEGRAELERVMIAWWCRRLGLEEREPAEALAELATHAQAGPLLRGLEGWLHAPDAGTVDVDALLAPYAAGAPALEAAAGER